MNLIQSRNQNQTVFNQEVPVLDNSLEESEQEIRRIEKSKITEPAKKRTWRFWLFVFMIGLVLLIGISVIIASFILQSPPTTNPVVQPTPTEQYEDNSLSAQIKQKREELRRLELSQDSLAFPQIDKKIEIKID